MVNPYVSRRPGDLKARMLRNNLLMCLDHPALRRATALARNDPVRLALDLGELGATWIVVDHRAYSPKQLDALKRIVEDALDLSVVFEDERFVVYCTPAIKDR
jgi:hypothetical protein